MLVTFIRRCGLTVCVSALFVVLTVVSNGALPRGQIVFVSERDGNYEIYSMNADGSGQRNLTQNPSDDMRPRLSPDGKRIVFDSYRDGNGEIYSMYFDGSGLLRLTNDPAYDTSANWSPDGARIVFTPLHAGSGSNKWHQLWRE